MNALCLSPVLALALISLPADDAKVDELARVSTLDQIERLHENETSVEIRFNGDHDEGLLEALARSHPKLERLVLCATEKNRVGDSDALTTFRNLKSLESRDAVSNLCFTNKKDEFKLQAISELTQLESLRLHLF